MGFSSMRLVFLQEEENAMWRQGHEGEDGCVKTEADVGLALPQAQEHLGYQKSRGKEGPPPRDFRGSTDSPPPDFGIRPPEMWENKYLF